MRKSYGTFVVLAVIFAARVACANSLIVIDAAGRAIGYYAGTCDQSTQYFAVYSIQGYYACLFQFSGHFDSQIMLPGFVGFEVSESGFEATNCVGRRLSYMNTTGDGPFFGGFVLGSQHDKAAYTVNDGVLSPLLMIASNSIAGSSCSNFSSGPTSFYAVPVFDNDITVTGLSNVDYAPPLRMLPLPDSALNDVIFFDGFE